MDNAEQYLSHHPFFAGMSAAALRKVASCGYAKQVNGGGPLFYQGDHADAMYVVREGRFELRVHRRKGRGTTIDALTSGDVLGWSWLVPPHRWMFDAFAVQDSDVIVLDGGCLREKCDTDSELGYALLMRVTHMMHQRLDAARARLAEQDKGFYGHL